jgi:O-antigen/teichoic acid export membrane protein
MLKPVDRTRSVLANTLASLVAQVSGIAVTIVLTPYVLHTVGLEQFGLWALIGGIAAYARLLMFGFGRGTIRFISFHSERRELDVVRSIVSYGVLSHLAVGLVLTPVAWLGAHYLVRYLHLSAGTVDTARKLFPLVFAYVFCAWAVRPLGALLTGLERSWLTSVTAIAGRLVYAVAVVVALSRGAGLYGLVVASFAQTAFQAVVFYVLGRRLIGGVFGNPFALPRSTLGEMTRYGGWMQVNAAAGLVNYETDAIVIGTWVDVSSVGFYAIGNRIANLVRTIPLTLLAPLLPAATGLHAAGDDAGIARTVLRGSRLVGLLTVAMSGFVVASAPLIMRAWLGRGYPDVVAIADALVLAYAAGNLTGVGATIVVATGRPRYQSHYAIAGMALNLASTLVLVPFFGLFGVIAGTVFALVTSSAYFVWRFHRLLGYPLWEYFGDWLLRLVAATALAALPVLLLRLGLPHSVTDARGPGLGALLGLGLVYSVLLLGALRLVRFLHASDLAVLERALPARLRPLASSPGVAFLFGAGREA